MAFFGVHNHESIQLSAVLLKRYIVRLAWLRSFTRQVALEMGIHWGDTGEWNGDILRLILGRY